MVKSENVTLGLKLNFSIIIWVSTFEVLLLGQSHSTEVFLKITVLEIFNKTFIDECIVA